MRGMVFNEFLDFVEAKTSPAFVEDMLSHVQLPSGGAYTSVGCYSHTELLTMLGYMHVETGSEVAKMVHAFGQHLFARFALRYPDFFSDVHSVLDFLQGIESHIHTEVQKLYPDAELPHFDCHRAGRDELEMVYSSSRPFGDLAHGLIVGALAHFGETARVDRQDLPSDKGARVRFVIRKAA